MPEQTETEAFAVVEVMGHNVFAGKIREHIIGGTGFIRVDVPALPESKTVSYGHTYIHPAIPGFTKIIGCGSIYAITPCSEKVALKVAEQRRVAPVTVLDTQTRVKALAVRAEDHEQEDEY